MKKIITALCILICVILLCTSCSKKMDIAEFYENANVEYESTPILTNGFNLTALDELNFKKKLGSILVFTNDSGNERYKYYNTETDRFILAFSAEKVKDHGSISVMANTFIYIIIGEADNYETVYTLNLYDSNGNKLASKKLNDYYSGFYVDNYITSSLDLLQFDSKIYRISEDGDADLILDNPFFGNLPTGLIKTTGYYYQKGYNEVTVYDHSLKQVLYWTVPFSSYNSSSFNCFILSEEKILAQVTETLPDSEKDYDYISNGGTKYALTSFLIDVESGKVKETDLDYKVNEVIYSSNVLYGNSLSELCTFSDKIDNYATINYIEDKKLHSSVNTFVCLSGKNASVKLEIAPEYDIPPVLIAPDCYWYISASGNRYLLDKNFEIIANVNAVNEDTPQNEYYIIIDNKVYNYNIDLIYDLEDNEQELFCLMNNSLIVSEDTTYNGTEYYLRTEYGNMIEIDNFDPDLSNEHYYVTVENNYDGTKNYAFYNGLGNKILNVKGVDSYESVETVYTYDNDSGYIVCFTVDGQESYYRISR